MTLQLILKRMRREWRSLTILLLAVCLLTGFFALGPFYIRAVTDVGLRFELDNAPIEARQITLVIEDEPISAEALRVVGEQLGPLAVDYRHLVRADYNPPTTTGGIQDGGLATGGYYYQYGNEVTWTSPRLPRTFQPFAFDNFAEYLTLVEGRWPVRLPPPDVVDPTGLSDVEQQARQIGPYTRGQVEIVITSAVAEEAELELGSRLVLGTLRPDGSGAVAVVVVVGIAEPLDPNAEFWNGNRNFLEGAEVDMGLGQFRYDYGMATTPEAYTDWLAPVTPGNSYLYVIDLNTDVITSDNISAINDDLKVLQNRLSAYHPSATILSGLPVLLENYSSDVKDTEGPIILLSGAIMILLMYHLINTVALVLEQQGAEWSSLVSRGGSVTQLVIMQGLTVGFIALGGMLAGPLISILFMRGLEQFGPLATALGDRPLGSTDIPTISIYLSIAAALAAALVLTAPALPAARRSLLRLKQLVSRPPTRPAWARYALDVVLLIVGAGFMLRLYYLVGGDFGDLLNNVLAAPTDVVQLIADNLNQTGGLNDPFNLLGPALVLTGLALMWLRFFPWLTELFAGLFDGSRALTTPLAVWNVARDPNHYAQLVLLLIGTLALGTASLGLSETRDQGAWQAAREETGGAVRVETVPAQVDADDVNWATLPGVSDYAAFMHVTGDPGSAANDDVYVLGLDPAQAIAAYPQLTAHVAPLQGLEAPPPPGLEMPDDATVLALQVYSLPQARDDDPAVRVELTAYLQDELGIPYRVNLERRDLASANVGSDDAPSQLAPPTPVERWLTFEGDMPERGTPPYRLMRVGINSRQGNIDAFEHTIFIDQVATRDAFGTATVVESFEDEANLWDEATVANPYAASWVSTASNVSRVQGVTAALAPDAVEAVDGPTALRLDYRMSKLGGRQREPSIVVNEPTIGRVPVVISAPMAETFAGQGGMRSLADEPLTIGDVQNVVLNVGSGSVEIGFEVVGVIPSGEIIPSFAEDALLMITVTEVVQPVINQAGTSSYFFDANTIWLNLPDREPSAALEAELNEIDGVQNVIWAWDRYGEIQREPLPSAVAGMLFAGFWISLLLSLLDFAFYLMVTARQRLFTFAVLRSLGWNAGHIWRLLFIEQIVLVAPALVIGSLIGAGLAYLLLPFLALVGGETLKLPWLSLAGLLLVLVVSFTALMGVAATFLRRMSVNQVLRLGEE